MRHGVWLSARYLPTMRSFAGIALISDRIPDETTILAFRHLLEQNNLGKEILKAVGTLQSQRHGHEAGRDRRCDHHRCTKLDQK